MEENEQNKIIIMLLAIIVICGGILLFKMANPKSKEINIYSNDSTEQTNYISSNQNNSNVQVQDSMQSSYDFMAKAQKNHQKSYMIIIIVTLTIIILTIVSLWKIFSDSEYPGWQCLIPILSNARLYQIVNLPWWLALVILIPYLGQIILGISMIVVSTRLAKMYNKSGLFAVGLILLPPIFYPILAFKSK